MPDHIALADRAALAVVAPCTANLIAKLAHGLADDLLSATLLASQATKLIAPAMNDGMWANPATQDNLALLRQRGFIIVDPGEGFLWRTVSARTYGRGQTIMPPSGRFYHETLPPPGSIFCH